MQYKTPPRAALNGTKPKAEVYIIWATPNDAIPWRKYWGHTNSASPKHENARPNRILRENAYLKLKTFSTIYVVMSNVMSFYYTFIICITTTGSEALK